MTALYTDHRDAARAVLRSALDAEGGLRPREGQFLGGLAPLTEKQANWLGILLDKHGLSPLAGDES